MTTYYLVTSLRGNPSIFLQRGVYAHRIVMLRGEVAAEVRAGHVDADLGTRCGNAAIHQIPFRTRYANTLRVRLSTVKVMQVRA